MQFSNVYLMLRKKIKTEKKQRLVQVGGSLLYSQHFGRPRQEDHLRLGVQDQPDQHGKTPSSEKRRASKGYKGWLKITQRGQEARTLVVS